MFMSVEGFISYLETNNAFLDVDGPCLHP
jgi:hypothetical protein